MRRLSATGRGIEEKRTDQRKGGFGGEQKKKGEEFEKNEGRESRRIGEGNIKEEKEKDTEALSFSVGNRSTQSQTLQRH